MRCREIRNRGVGVGGVRKAGRLTGANDRERIEKAKKKRNCYIGIMVLSMAFGHGSAKPIRDFNMPCLC